MITTNPVRAFLNIIKYSEAGVKLDLEKVLMIKEGNCFLSMLDLLWKRNQNSFLLKM